MCHVPVCKAYFVSVKQGSKILCVLFIISANILTMVDLSCCLCKKNPCGHTCFFVIVITIHAHVKIL